MKTQIKEVGSGGASEDDSDARMVAEHTRINISGFRMRFKSNT
jgi:hypothetical protein